jgi:SAM-dependent methyltransferase
MVGNKVADLRRKRERYSRWARRVGGLVGGPVERRIERHLLTRSWSEAAPEHLETYLVRGYQNPVINGQSILARHHVVREIDGDRHDALMEEELRWAVQKHRELRRRQRELTAEHGLEWRKLRRTKRWARAYDEVMGEGAPFAVRWTEALRDEPGPCLSVIEAACGSANDYRYVHSYGMGHLLTYRGFDLTEANIGNARRMFPVTDFRLGDVLNIEAEDKSFDWAVAHDLLEHLSPAALERAIDELSRVSRRGVLISFFRMSDAAEHQVQPTRFYHYNELSRRRVEESFARSCSSVEWVHVRTMLAEQYDFLYYYNRRAWTMIARH